MFSNSDELLKYIKDEGVEMVDVRFCDLPGVMQHFTVPVSSFDQSVFDDGLAFDGSSIRGFQAIHESDMSLFPDVDHGLHRPVPRGEDPGRQLLHPRPDHRRGLLAATRATSPRRRWPTSPPPASATPRTSPPRPSSTSSTSVRFATSAERGLLPHRLRGGRLELRLGPRRTNRGYKVKYKGGYFPVAPYDHFGELRDEMVIELEKSGLLVERAHHEVGTAGQAEINYKFDELLKAADDVMKFKYIIKNTAWRNGKTATFMPKPIFGDNGSGMHCHQSIWKDGEPLFYDETGYAGLSDMARYYIGGILKHAPSLLAFTNPTVNSYHRLVPGFEAPISLVYSQRNRSACVRIPITGANPKAKRVEFRCPDPSANPYLAFSALLLAGIDGIQNKIEPPAPVDKDIYELPPDEMADIDQVPTSLGAVLDNLESGPRVPHRRQRLHARPDRDLDRLQAHPGDPARAAAAAPARVRALLRHLSHTQTYPAAQATRAVKERPLTSEDDVPSSAVRGPFSVWISSHVRLQHGSEGLARGIAAQGAQFDPLRVTGLVCNIRRDRSPGRHRRALHACPPAQRPGGAATFTVGMPPPTRAITAKDGSLGGVRLAVDGPGRDVDEVAGARLDVAVVALELEAEHAADDVQARLVAVVVVPARDRARLGLDLAGPEQRQLEGERAVHARRRVCGSQVVGRDDPYGPGQAHHSSGQRATDRFSRRYRCGPGGEREPRSRRRSPARSPHRRSRTRPRRRRAQSRRPRGTCLRARRGRRRRTRRRG